MSWCERGQKCTCFIDRLFGKDWSICCEEHDINYMKNPHNLTKAQIDKDLFECLKNKSFYWNAVLMYGAIRFLPFSYWYWNKYRKR